MTFKQIDINLDRFYFVVEESGITIIKKRLFSVSKRFVPFENIGSETTLYRKRKLGWLIISCLFFLIALSVFISRLKGQNVSDTAETFWITLSAVFFLIYSFSRKNSLFLVKENKESSIEFLATKIHQKRLKQFIIELLLQRDKYLSHKYQTFPGLSIDESISCDQAKVDPRDGVFLKRLTNNSVQLLRFENKYLDQENLLGIRSMTTEKKVRQILRDHQAKIIEQGKYIYICEIKDNEYFLGFLGNISDPFKIIEFTGTNGVNHNLLTKDIIEKCKQWDGEFDITLTGIGLDFCEFEVKSKNIDYKKLASEVYEFCPDIVDQGTETLEQLESEIQSKGRIFLWWD